MVFSQQTEQLNEMDKYLEFLPKLTRGKIGN